MSKLVPDPYAALRAATPARIGLGRSGDSLPTKAVLEFQLAHARARDAVHGVLDADALASALAPLPTVLVQSQAADASDYLRRPDLGRRLCAELAQRLAVLAGAPDVVFVVADGLSAAAVQTQAAAMIAASLPALEDLAIGPIVIARRARVALGDEIGARLGAGLCVLLVGERPGLSVADSLGVYITFDPRPGRRDSERNCISNIHANGGLSIAQAAATLVWLARAALAAEDDRDRSQGGCGGGRGAGGCKTAVAGVTALTQLADMLLRIERQADLLDQLQLRFQEINMLLLVVGEVLEQVFRHAIVDRDAKGGGLQVKGARGEFRIQVHLDDFLHGFANRQRVQLLHVGKAVEEQDAGGELVGVGHFLNGFFPPFLRQALVAPVVEDAVMQPILVDGGQLAAQATVEKFNHSGVAAHV